MAVTTTRVKAPAVAGAPGLGAAAEVAKRLTFWEERRFEDLLRRDEEHHLLADQARRRNAAAWTAPPLWLIELSRRPQLAPIARPPPGLSYQCSFLRRATTSRRPRSSFPPSLWACKQCTAPRTVNTCPTHAYFSRVHVAQDV